MDTSTLNQATPATESVDRKPPLVHSTSHAEVAPRGTDPVDAPTMIIIASASTQAAVDLMTKFNQMFGDEARFSIATDGTNAGGWPLTLAFGEVGCHLRADFVEPILEQIADKIGDVAAGHCGFGDGDTKYKVTPPSWQEVDATYF